MKNFRQFVMERNGRITATASLLFLLFFTQISARAQVASAFASPRQPANVSREAAATVVIFNEGDAISLDLAAYYAQKRNIPLDHLIGLQCSPNEEISREEYDRTIAIPLRKVFSDRGWWRMPLEQSMPVTENRVRFLVPIRGVPLKISGTSSYPGDHFEGPQPVLNKNEAAVDSELAVLGLRSPVISGFVTNPYYRSFTSFLDEQMAPLMLVCRLDGPTPQIVRQMIDDAIATERDGLWGFAYVDSRGNTSGGLAEGDKWMGNIVKDAREHGIPTIVDDQPDQFPAEYPMRNAALYFGWYSQEVAGPISRPDFRFNPGTIACHIHSFSAGTVRNPASLWVGPLLAKGATATLGNVYEPFLAFTSNLDVFEDRLRNGFTFGESAYMSMRVLSWMSTFVGDPLYRPFKIVQENASTAPKSAAEWIAYRDGAKLWFSENREAGEKKLLESAQQLHSGIIFEGLGLLQWQAANDTSAAIASFAQAERVYTNPEDAVRTILHRVQILRTAQNTKDALALARRGMKSFPKATASKVLQAAVAQMAPTPAPSPSSSPKREAAPRTSSR